MTNKHGFTLVELIVVMAIFIVIMLMISSSFENILRTSGQQVKSAETSTEGIVGLEMLRSDLEHAGFGLFWAFPPSFPPITFSEVATSPIQNIDATTFNDSVPRAVQVEVAPSGKQIIDGSSNTNAGSAYLVLKSTRVALHTTGKKWAYVDYQYAAGNNTSYVTQWKAPDNTDLKRGESVVTLNTTFTTTGAPNKVLVMSSGAVAGSYYAMPGDAPVQPPSDAFKPGDSTQLFVVYGVDPGTTLRMPYNRADYYVKRPAAGDVNTFPFPSGCNPGTGVLFKAVVRQTDGTFANAEYPLLNCVGDMQVEFELGDATNAAATSFSPAQLYATGTSTALSASDIRDQLKNVHVYILAHEGKKDPNYNFPGNTIQVGDPSRPNSSGRIWSGDASCTGDNCMQKAFGPDWRNYRWKVYTIAVHPKNLD